jgi:hypothetical protein
MTLREALQQLDLALALIIRVQVITQGVGDWMRARGKQPILVGAFATAIDLVMTTLHARCQDARNALAGGKDVDGLQI